MPEKMGVCKLHSMRWHCWLSTMKTIQPTETQWWGVDVVLCVEQGADCLQIPLSFQNLTISCPSKFRMVLSFSYWLTLVVLKKRLLNGYSEISVCAYYSIHMHINLDLCKFKSFYKNCRNADTSATCYLYISGSSDARWWMSTSPFCELSSLDRKKLANGSSVNMFS